MRDDDEIEVEPWSEDAVPYMDLVSEGRAKDAFCNAFPDVEPPWIAYEATPAREVASPAPTRPRPTSAREVVDAAVARAREATPTTPAYQSPPPTSPIPIGERCRVLTGPVYNHRAATRDGRVASWSGSLLGIVLDGDAVTKHFAESRVSGFDAFGNPTHPSRVCWCTGDVVPLETPAAPHVEGGPEITRAEIARDPSLKQYVTRDEDDRPRWRPYPGLLG